MHAWCALTTHFHLLLRSPRGELSEALRRAQNEYSRFFNRRHRRDGTLVREPLDAATDRLVESRIASTRFSRDDLDDLVGSAPAYVRASMKRKAKLADGGRVGLPVCDATSIRECVRKARGANGE